MSSMKVPKRKNIGGNFCGHNPAKPAFGLTKLVKKGKGGIPLVLTTCMERITDYYKSPRLYIPSLDLANESDRRQRSERRESCVRTLIALLNHTDVTSLRVGFPTADGFVNLRFSKIVALTGMNKRRVSRAVHDLKAAGLLTVAQAREKSKDGTWKGLVAVKAVSKQLFSMFGLSDMLKFERKKASKKQKLKIQRLQDEKSLEESVNTRTGKARFSVFMGSMTKKIVNPKRKENVSHLKRKNDEDWNKQLTLRAIKYKQDNPEWDSDMCFAKASVSLLG